MANFNVRVNGLIDSEDELAQVTKAIAAEIESLEQKVVAYLNANEGAAIDNYTVAQRKWDEGIALMQDASRNAAIALGEIRVGYVNGDNQGAAAFGAV
jgi:hypothetical protein